MNERIMKAVKEIEAIRDAMGREYAWKNAMGEMVSEWQYHYKDSSQHIISNDKERAISDRAKMLDVLRRFYYAHAFTHDGIDDFVTLFGVYCNYYIRFNLHRALPGEDDFGICALWDTVTEVKMQEYLGLLQQGIFKGLLEGFHEILNKRTNNFLKATMVYSYSLPYFYLFLYYAKAWFVCDGEGKSVCEDMMLDYLEDMNDALQEYCLGKSPFLRHVAGGELDQNPLPYIRSGYLKEHYAALLAQKMADAVSTLEKIWNIYQNEEGSGARDFCNEDCIHIQWAYRNLTSAKNAIHDLYDEEEDDKQEFVPNEWRDDDGIIYRIAFLSIPCFLNIPRDIAFLDLIDSMGKRRKAQREKESVQKEKDEIVQDFSHTYQNMRATALYNMAKTLLNKPDAEDRKLGRTALLEYTRKETLTKDVYMMKLKYEHNTEKLRNILRQSCTRPSSETYAIHDVLHQALLMCLVNVFYDQGTENARRMRSHLKDLWPDWKETILDFEKSIIFQSENCLKWLQAHGIDLHVAEEATWQSIGFFPDGYAAVMLRNILTELLVNTFKYGDLRKQIALTFAGLEQAITIEMENYLPDGKQGTSNSQVGIHSMGKMLHVLWGDTSKEDNERLAASYEDNKFHACLSLPMKVFSAKEEAK